MKYLLETNIFYYLATHKLRYSDLPNINKNKFYISPISIFEILFSDITILQRQSVANCALRMMNKGMKLLGSNYYAIAQHYKIQVTDHVDKIQFKDYLIFLTNKKIPPNTIELRFKPMKEIYVQKIKIWLENTERLKESFIKQYHGNLKKMTLTGKKLKEFRKNKEPFLKVYLKGLSHDLLHEICHVFKIKLDNTYDLEVPDTLRPYTDILMMYLYDLVETKRKPDGNDRTDLTHFLYCNMPVDKIITNDKYWIRLTQDTGYSDYLEVPNLRE